MATLARVGSQLDYVSLGEAWKASKISILIFILLVLITLGIGIFVVLLALDDAGKFEFTSNRASILNNKTWVGVFTAVAILILVLFLAFFFIYLFVILPRWVKKAEASKNRVLLNEELRSGLANENNNEMVGLGNYSKEGKPRKLKQYNPETNDELVTM